ncbi:alpha/beta hydrolase family protein [Ferdinandcohnia quinoae]|uniref:Alpha/beta fold hydrolase n=1 Tax=Fredinandcohnia quinoae TaxID=2918902 RepID=A0AAW5E460_9BACI|nr:alpha/beta fold hydrolase [Fredinandcohnia sp. SECRCQ15]MCH1624355.1 alpha/beta fold hydrolase [Fredinandcohnia sp. SECRCQ15]
MQKAISLTHNGVELRGMEHFPDGEKLPAVILYHGFTGTKLESHRLFLNISRALEDKGIASFRFDFLGSGESDGDFKNTTVTSQLAEAETIFNYVKSHPLIDADQILVLGFSMGGLVASLLAGKINSQIAKLILLAPAGTMGKMSETIKGMIPFVAEENAFDIGGNLIGAKFYEDVKAIEVWEQAAKYDGKVLLIHGTKDQAVPFTVSNLYIEHCYGENATLHPIEGSDHTFNSHQHKKDVIESIIKFV